MDVVHTHLYLSLIHRENINPYNSIFTNVNVHEDKDIDIGWMKVCIEKWSEVMWSRRWYIPGDSSKESNKAFIVSMNKYSQVCTIKWVGVVRDGFGCSLASSSATLERNEKQSNKSKSKSKSEQASKGRRMRLNMKLQSKETNTTTAKSSGPLYVLYVLAGLTSVYDA